MPASFKYESKLWKKGYNLVAGVDEVGRGPLAGPIVAAAVVFAPKTKISGIADSKVLSSKKREVLFEIIKEKALAIGIASICNKKIDLMGIGLANLLVMKMAIESLPFIPHYLLIDGERCRLAIAIPQKSFNDGDTKSTSIAAASIIAKITRDRIMVNYHRKYPVYEFPRHKGYGTKLHLRRLRKHGPSPIHRRSFSLARICRLKAEKVVQLELQPR